MPNSLFMYRNQVAWFMYRIVVGPCCTQGVGIRRGHPSYLEPVLSATRADEIDCVARLSACPTNRVSSAFVLSARGSSAIALKVITKHPTGFHFSAAFLGLRSVQFRFGES